MTDHVSSYFVPRSSSRPRHRTAFAQDIASLKAEGYGSRAMYVRKFSAHPTSGPIETDITVPRDWHHHAAVTRRSRADHRATPVDGRPSSLHTCLLVMLHGDSD